jgi:iron(III) transport system substrate-binding protein
MARGRLALTAALAATLASACGQAAAGTPAASAPASQAGLAGLVSAANREGTVVIWGNYPADADVPAVEKDFNARFGTQIHIQTVPVAAAQAQTRMVAESQGNRYDWDLFANFGSESLPDLTSRGLLAKVDWAGLFEKDLPSIKDAADSVPADYSGYALTFYDGGYAMIYNPTQSKPADGPQQWEDLGSPTFRSKLVISANGYPFNYLSVSPDWGPQKTEQLVRQIADNKPLLVTGSAQENVDRVVRNEMPFGVSDLSSILDAKGKGRPIEAIIPNYVPGDHRYTVLDVRAPHPNAARLYAAWEVSEGMKTFGVLRQSSRFTSPNSNLTEIISKQNPAAKVVTPTSTDSIKAQAAFLKTAAGIFTSPR